MINKFVRQVLRTSLREATVDKPQLERAFQRYENRSDEDRKMEPHAYWPSVLFIATNCQKLSSTTRRSLSHSSAKPNIASLTAWQSLIFSIEAPAGNDGVHTLESKDRILGHTKRRTDRFQDILHSNGHPWYNGRLSGHF